MQTRTLLRNMQFPILPKKALFIDCFVFQETYRLAIRTEGMIEDLVNNLKSENQELQMHCASAIFKVQTVRLQCACMRSAFTALNPAAYSKW